MELWVLFIVPSIPVAEARTHLLKGARAQSSNEIKRDGRERSWGWRGYIHQPWEAWLRLSRRVIARQQALQLVEAN
eukprot:2528364-Prymnesium_polylepis.1